MSTSNHSAETGSSLIGPGPSLTSPHYPLTSVSTSTFLVFSAIVEILVISAVNLGSLIASSYFSTHEDTLTQPVDYALFGLLLPFVIFTISIVLGQFSRLRLHSPSTIAVNALVSVGIAYLFSMAILFLLDKSHDYPHNTFIFQFFSVYLIVAAGRAFLRAQLEAAGASGLIQARRLAMIGDQGRCEALARSLVPCGVKTVGIFAAGDGRPAGQVLEDCRSVNPDEILLLGAREAGQGLSDLIEGLSRLSVAVHIAPINDGARAEAAQSVRVGGVKTLHPPAPSSILEQMARRAFDLSVADYINHLYPQREVRDSVMTGVRNQSANYSNTDHNSKNRGRDYSVAHHAEFAGRDARGRSSVRARTIALGGKIYERYGAAAHAWDAFAGRLSPRHGEAFELAEDRSGRIEPETVDRARSATIRMHATRSLRSDWWRRPADIVASLFLAVLLSPLLIATALLVAVGMGRPILFSQERVGLGGRVFKIYKFRSMKNSSASPNIATSRNDQRITPVGRLLRRTHLDELPQLWNIFIGDMTFVGPRPEQPGLVDQYSEVIPNFQLRHSVRPGLTGWSQVRYGYASSTDETRQKLAYDLYYVDRRCLRFDLKILVLTTFLLLDPDHVR